MAKFYGAVGYLNNVETSPGIWDETISRRNYSGDVIKNSKRWQNTEHLNDNIIVNNIISIIADPYAYDHFFTIKFVEWMGTSWEVTNVEVQSPRLLLTLGGVYNGPKE